MHGIALLIGYCALAVFALGFVLWLVVILVESERARTALQTIASLAFIGAIAWLDLSFNNGAFIGWLGIIGTIMVVWTLGRAFWYRKSGDPSDEQVRRKKLGYDD